jgi:hypothetical protein
VERKDIGAVSKKPKVIFVFFYLSRTPFFQGLALLVSGLNEPSVCSYFSLSREFSTDQLFIIENFRYV